MWRLINGGRVGCCYKEYEPDSYKRVFNVWPLIYGGMDGCTYNEFEPDY
jgi:hypothetical protein